MKLVALGRSQTGDRLRNEDDFLCDPDRGIFAVCDGMGGHFGGDVAAALAIDRISNGLDDFELELHQIRQGTASPALLGHIAGDLIREANEAIAHTSLSDPALRGMGCTATVLLVAGAYAAMAHVGDSRLYLLRDGHLMQVSEDHTMEAVARERGVENPPEWLRHTLTRSVGTQVPVDVDEVVFGILPGDRLLLCSDGVHGEVPVEQLLHGGTADEAAERLDTSVVAAGPDDNFTLVLVDAQVGEQVAMVASELLGLHPVFSGLTRSQRAQLLADSPSVVVGSGVQLVDVGEPVTDMFLVTRGSIRQEIPGDKEVRRLGPGTVIGWSRIDGARQGARARLVTRGKTSMVRLSVQAVRRWMLRRPVTGLPLLMRARRRPLRDAV